MKNPIYKLNFDMKQKVKLVLLVIFAFYSCEKWDETSDISHVTYLPEFEFTGGDFLSFVQSDQRFIDPGIRATSQGSSLNIYTMNPENIPDSLNEPGVYVVRYYSENSEGFSNTADRIIAVTYENVENNDLSGTYTTSLFGETVTTRITKVNEKGLYKSEEIFGYPGVPMPGRFVDLGRNNLVLLPGEGFFGNYDISEGTYSRNSLSWTVILLDEPNTGIAINVTWIKID